MNKHCLLLSLLLVVFSLTACTSVEKVNIKISMSPAKKARVESNKNGPPPHAPAHGYRHKHKEGALLEFDSALGAYVVIGVSGTYFQKGLFMKSPEGHWKVSAKLKGPWREAKAQDIPYKLKMTKTRKAPSKQAKAERKETSSKTAKVKAKETPSRVDMAKHQEQPSKQAKGVETTQGATHSQAPVRHAMAQSKDIAPPPHAPAHGYRHKHNEGSLLEFDSALGAYVVIGVSDTYFQKGLFMKIDEGHWKVSTELKGPWRKAKAREIPTELAEAKGKEHNVNRHARKKK